VADDTRGPGNGLLYALLGALCVVVAGGGYYIYLNNQDLPSLSQGAPPAAPAATPAPAPAPAPAPQQAAPAGPSANQLAQARAAIADARRMAARGDFTGAEMALQGADRSVPGLAETAAARREIADLRTMRGRTPRALPPWSKPHAPPLPDATTAPPTARSTKPSASTPAIPPWSARATSSWKRRPGPDDGTNATDLRRLAAKKKPTRFHIGWASQRA
jgi:hypothetical protein